MNRVQTERDTFVRIRGLGFAHGRHPVLDRIDMDIPRGRVTAVMGLEGAGKTALLRVIAGQLTPYAGRVDVDGVDVHALDPDGLARLRRRMGVVFQNGGLLADRSVYGNVAFPLREHTALPEPLVRQLVYLRLEAVGLRCARDLMPHELSAGMVRRVALARALALDPECLLCDEPFAGRDPVTRGILARLVRRVTDELGVTAVVASHDVGAALSVADYAYVIHEGHVVGRGTPEELRASRAPAIRQFVRGKADGPIPFHHPGPTYAEELLA